jgi:hypothetical protein
MSLYTTIIQMAVSYTCLMQTVPNCWSTRVHPRFLVGLVLLDFSFMGMFCLEGVLYIKRRRSVFVLLIFWPLYCLSFLQTCIGHSHLNYSCIQRHHDNIARKYERETYIKITTQMKKFKTCETLNRITLSSTTTYEFHRQMQ